MKDAIETSAIAFIAIVAIVLIFAAVLGLRSVIETVQVRASTSSWR